MVIRVIPNLAYRDVDSLGLRFVPILGVGYGKGVAVNRVTFFFNRDGITSVVILFNGIVDNTVRVGWIFEHRDVREGARPARRGTHAGFADRHAIVHEQDICHVGARSVSIFAVDPNLVDGNGGLIGDKGIGKGVTAFHVTSNGFRAIPRSIVYVLFHGVLDFHADIAGGGVNLINWKVAERTRPCTEAVQGKGLTRVLPIGKEFHRDAFGTLGGVTVLAFPSLGDGDVA